MQPLALIVSDCVSPVFLPLQKPRSHYFGLMESSPSSNAIDFDSILRRKEPKIPDAFVWSRRESQHYPSAKIEVAAVDLQEFLYGDEPSRRRIAEDVRGACARYGFFQVINHGVDVDVSRNALAATREFFNLPLSAKARARKRPGRLCGYSGAHAERFTSNLPWKETLSFEFDYCENVAAGGDVVEYFMSNLGEEFESMGRVYEKYCVAMKELSLSIMELLGISLGVEREFYRKFFEDGGAIMRCNNYPPCQEPELALGTGPHCDPTSLTILQQDGQVDGLQVFDDGSWWSVSPATGALVIIIGDSLMALTNGEYKSCLHRAVVNRERERRSLALFVCPREDKVVRPPKMLLSGGGGEGEEAARMYPDFTWRELREFTQNHHRADDETLRSFIRRLLSTVA